MLTSAQSMKHHWSWAGMLLIAGMFSLPAAALMVEQGAQDSTASTLAAQSIPVTTAAPISIVLQPRSKAIRQGDEAEFDVTISAQPNVQLLGSEYPKTLGDWEITRVQLGKPRYQNGQFMRQDQLTLVTYVPGKVDIPFLPQKFKDQNGQVAEFHSAPFSLQVAPLPVRKTDQPGQIRGLKGPIGLISWWWLALAAALAAAVILVLAWLYFRKRRAYLDSQPAKPKRPAEEVARERLQALQASGLLAHGDFKPYYIELSDILRRFLEEVYAIPASDRTTFELLRELKNSACERQDMAASRNVLEQSDMVKFAKFLPDEKEAQQDWAAVQGVVERIAASRQASLIKPEEPAQA